MMYAASLAFGLVVGVAYGWVGLRSPAPPIIALLGLLGMLTGEQLVAYVRGHPNVVSDLLHAKSFSHRQAAKERQDSSG